MITNLLIERQQPIPDYSGTVVAGVDEAGRGCLAGPVTAAAVVFPETAHLGEYRDSKQLTALQRTRLARRIYAEASCCAVVHGSAREIDRYNILNATLRAMRRAVAKLIVRPELVLTDGNRNPDYPMPGWAIIRGDDRVSLIGAASIIAKHERDAFMIRMHERYPHYGFLRHKGYATRHHRLMLLRHGPCALHRSSFKPLRR